MLQGGSLAHAGSSLELPVGVDSYSCVGSFPRDRLPVHDSNQERTLWMPGNARVVGQKELDRFREEMRSKIGDAYTVVLKDKKLPLALLNDHQKVRTMWAGTWLSLVRIGDAATL